MAVVAASAAIDFWDREAQQAGGGGFAPHRPLDDARLAPFGDAAFRRVGVEELADES